MMSEKDDFGDALLSIARQSIARKFEQDAEQDFLKKYAHPSLSEPGASFVTLTIHENLRGCIGSLEACRSLSEDVAANARMAAFNDPRFPPLSRLEWKDVRVEVSVLDKPQAMFFSSEEDALSQLRPDIDGIILSSGHIRATFLPQVWEDLPSPATFLRQLKLKAGLPAGFWDETIRLERYSVHKWQET